MAIEIRILRSEDQGLLSKMALGVFDDPIDAARTHEFLADPRHHLVVAVITTPTSINIGTKLHEIS